MFHSYFPAYLVAVYSRKHDVQQDQVRREAVQCRHYRFAVVDNQGLVAFLGKIESDQFSDIIVVIYNENFLFSYHMLCFLSDSNEFAPGLFKGDNGDA